MAGSTPLRALIESFAAIASYMLALMHASMQMYFCAMESTRLWIIISGG